MAAPLRSARDRAMSPLSIRTLCAVFFLTLFLAPTVSTAQSLPDSPLAACPDSPNCERVSRGYDVAPDTLFDAAQKALDDLGPSSVEVQPDTQRVHAVYRVALIFKDDVHLAVGPHESGSVLHIRSASRVGYSDLGVNADRVERFFEALESHL